MRIKEKVENIDYDETKDFFKRRADKFRKDNPYSVTMYQDNDEQIVRERNRKEVQRLKPQLKLGKTSRILDVACGIGRWADAITEEVAEYCGVDFSGELIAIANARNTKSNFFFYEGAVTELEKVLREHGKENYDTVLLIGILVYVNDRDMEAFFRQLERVCATHTRICIREPIGIEERLTLKDFFSEELRDNYNAIYRTRNEIVQFMEKTLFSKGFRIEKEGFMFEEDALNNRKETSQYYFILER